MYLFYPFYEVFDQMSSMIHDAGIKLPLIQKGLDTTQLKGEVTAKPALDGIEGDCAHTRAPEASQ